MPPPPVARVTEAVASDPPWRVAVAAASRLRAADGFSHARALAFASALVAVQGLIVLLALAAALHQRELGVTVREVVTAFAPGPVGDALLGAVAEAGAEGRVPRVAALALGVTGVLVTGTTGMGQLQRSLNRIHSVERDRPTLRKYGFALVLTVTVGALTTVAFALVAFGRGVVAPLGSALGGTAWSALRIPAGLLAVAAALAVLFRWCPNRPRPPWVCVAVGAVVASALWVAATSLLGAAFTHIPSLGALYGPLAGTVALLLWAFLSSVAVLYGGALACELELRATSSEPRP